jgi:ABC-type glycerol-3-phosphate transport system permease component
MILAVTIYEGAAILVAGVLIVLGAPIAEELFFRGFVFAGLRRDLPLWPAAVIAGGVFGLLHLLAANIDVAVLLAVFGVVLACGGYAPGFWSALVLFTLMMPTEVLIVALFDVVEWMGLFGTLPALILPFMASATSTFLFRQHFLRIPRDLVEAAQVDGAGPLRFLRSILVPLSWNAIAALAVVDVIYVWNMYLWPRINAVGPDSTMVQVGLVNLLTDQDVNHYGVVMAGAVVSMLPVLIIFLLLQERFTRGFALGAER